MLSLYNLRGCIGTITLATNALRCKPGFNKERVSKAVADLMDIQVARAELVERSSDRAHRPRERVWFGEHLRKTLYFICDCPLLGLGLLLLSLWRLS